MQKLLIAEASRVLTDSLTGILQDQWEIHVCTNGYAASNMLKYLQPDAAVINLELEEKDGLTVLEEAFPNVPPVILALTTYTSPYIEQKAASLGVGYLTRIPCRADLIHNRLQDMQKIHANPLSSVTRHLDALGIASYQNGYRYLQLVISHLATNPHQLLKELYPIVIKKCSAGSVNCVERSIRYAIKDAWSRRHIDTWSQYFSPDRSGDIPCPSNKAFIFAIVKKL